MVKTLFIILIICPIFLISQVNIPFNSAYKYLKGTSFSDSEVNWNTNVYNDDSWQQSQAPFRYGDGTGGTVLNDMQNNYIDLYLRATFNANHISEISKLVFKVDFDDAFIIWINGQEVVRGNYPTNGSIPDSHEFGNIVQYNLDISNAPLIEGENLIAIKIINAEISSSDFYIDLELKSIMAMPQLPDSAKVNFSYSGGYYQNAFDLTLTSNIPDADIIYTLDGSNPRTSTTSYTQASPILINIDPNSTTGRGKTPGFIVRASLVKAGYEITIPKTNTYLFINKTSTQTFPGFTWPMESFFSTNGHNIDYTMDQNIVSNTTRLEEALLDLPIMSITTDNSNLFNQQTGIYVNSSQGGIEWERDCSIELLHPQTGQEFQANAGLRMRGAWSRQQSWNPKYSMRFIFRKEYGNKKLKYPLFEDEGVDEYWKIDLPTAQNCSWTLDESYPGNLNTMVKDLYARDCSREMNQPYTRSRYYHLFLNGMYWGIYNTQERADADYAKSYFGGSQADYDAIKINEATDGDLTLWNKLWERCENGFVNNNDYFSVQGKDEFGIPNGTDALVDIDNLIDYMMVIFYIGNHDGPVSSYAYNKGINNFIAIKKKTDKTFGFKFFIHDSEYAMLADTVYVGEGLNEDRVNLATRTDDFQMNTPNFNVFNPQWLHYKLSENKEYRLKFADRAYKYLNNNGIFTPNRATQMFMERANIIETAIIAESARWGDALTFPARDQSTWNFAISKVIDEFIPYRTAILKNQLQRADLYTQLPPPIVQINGTDITESYSFNNNVDAYLYNLGSTGNIYYTIDGTDPRMVGDGISSAAFNAENGKILSITNSTIINARIKDGANWSAIYQLNLLKENEDYSHLKVTEIHYHPQEIITGTDTVDGEDLEFIEFKNIGNNSINLSGIVIDSAIEYTFPTNTLLPPQKFYVIASKPAKFYNYYELMANGNFSKQLSNAGEQVLVIDPNGNTIMDFEYSDNPPWPIETDGQGFSLSSVQVNPTGNPNDYSYWKKSYNTGGSPFQDDLYSSISEETHHLDVTVYPNPTSNELYIRTSAKNKDIRYSLYDIYGKKILNAVFKDNEIIKLNEHSLSYGIYVICVQYENQNWVSKISYIGN